MDPQRAGGGADLSDSPALSVVIPAYNEGDNIRPLLEGITALRDLPDYEVLVVYDFAGDTTVPAVEALALPRVRLVLNEIGRGALNAIRAGFQAAQAPHVLVTMADLSDDPADIPRMYALGVAGADVVAGSRYMRGGRQVGGPFVKRTMSRTAGLSLHWIGGLPVHDPTSNFKLYSRRLLDQVTIESEAGFELALELTVKAHLLGLRLAEVPTTWRDRTAGESRFRLRQWLPHYLRWYRLGITGRFRRR